MEPTAEQIADLILEVSRLRVVAIVGLSLIFSTLLWRVFILAKNQRNFFALMIVLVTAASASAQSIGIVTRTYPFFQDTGNHKWATELEVAAGSNVWNVWIDTANTTAEFRVGTKSQIGSTSSGTPFTRKNSPWRDITAGPNPGRYYYLGTVTTSGPSAVWCNEFGSGSFPIFNAVIWDRASSQEAININVDVEGGGPSEPAGLYHPEDAESVNYTYSDIPNAVTSETLDGKWETWGEPLDGLTLQQGSPGTFSPGNAWNVTWSIPGQAAFTQRFNPVMTEAQSWNSIPTTIRPSFMPGLATSIWSWRAAFRTCCLGYLYLVFVKRVANLLS